jgi:hypothetical protein
MCGARGTTSVASLIAMMFSRVSVSVAQDINGLTDFTAARLKWPDSARRWLYPSTVAAASIIVWIITGRGMFGFG